MSDIDLAGELRTALDALAATPAMQRADLERALSRARRTRVIGWSLGCALASCALLAVLARGPAPVSPLDAPPPVADDIVISVDDGTGPLVIVISGGT